MLRCSLLIVLVAACNNPETQPDAATHDAATHDAPHVSPDAASDAPPAERHGQVSVAKGTGPQGAISSVSANLSDVANFGTTVATDGPCTLYHQIQGGRFSAGIIMVSGTTPSLTMTPSGTSPSVHYTTSPTPATNPYADGATITFSAAGGEFPAFSGTVTAPASLAGFTVPTTVSRAGYTATWTAGAGPKVWVIFSTLSMDTLLCRVNDTGTFTVPASAMALIPAANTQVAVAVARVSQHDIVTPDVLLFVVSVIASTVVPLTS